MKISNCFIEFSQSNFKLNVPYIKLNEKKINCLIGDNGCGKSTLLKQIASDNCDHDIDSKVMMLQKPFIFSGTVEDNIKLIKKLCPSSKIDSRKLLEDLNLLQYLEQRAKSLSGGQRQRLAFALVILSDYDLIILDEPFNNIDIKSQQLMIAVMKQFDKTYLLASHKIGLSKKIGDYFFLIENGEIIDEGTKTTFFDNVKVKELMEME